MLFRSLLILSVSTILLFSGDLFAQSTSGDASLTFVAKFRQAQEAIPREPVYLHTDRDWYGFGENIWFSAYAVTGGYNLLSDISQVLYVELVDPEGNVVKRNIIELTEGRGSGSIALDSNDNKGGNYSIRAYTKWGRQFGESYIFEKKLDIISDDSEDASEGDIDLQFFPEGGKLISGVTSSVGFKAVGNDGLGVQVSGRIFSSEGTEVAAISSEHKGMGAFEFEPEFGSSYTAEVNGEEYSLPEVERSGSVLRIRSENEKFQVNISSSEDVRSSFLLFAHVRGVIYFAEQISADDPDRSVEVSKASFPTGIVHFTLLSNGTPVSERLVFSKNKLDETKVSVRLSHSVFETRESGRMEIQIYDSNGSEVNATASVSIFDDETQPYNQFRGDIYTHFLLGAEIKGYIEDPGFYFSEDENADQYLNLLLMTQGWRAYNMSDPVLISNMSSLVSPERGISIQGNVGSLWRNNSLAEAALFIKLDDIDEPQVVTTNNNGNFRLGGLKLYGSSRFTIRGNNPDGNDKLQITLNDQFEGFSQSVDPVVQGNELIEDGNLEIQAANTDELQARVAQVKENTEQFMEAEMYGELEEVTVTGRAETQSWQGNVFTGETTSGAGINLEEKEVLRGLAIEQVINQLPGVRVNESGVTLTRSTISLSGGSSTPLFLLDGYEVDYAIVRQLNTSNVRSLRLVNSAADLAIYGSRAPGGVILIDTYEGGSANLPPKRGYEVGFVEGYQQPQNFYVPKYGVNVPKDLDSKDDRITIAWEPLVIIQNSEAVVNFWNNDIPSRYRVVVEGITESGNVFSTTTVFEVED